MAKRKKDCKQKDGWEFDLHGMTVQEALNFIDNTISRAVLDGISRISFIHGIGGGALKKALHHRCAELKVVTSYKLDISNPGVTLVFL